MIQPIPAAEQRDLLLEEHDACALIANVRKKGGASHGNVKRTIEALMMMAHRSGIVDGEGDGCGVLTDIPRRLWAKRLVQAGLFEAVMEGWMEIGLRDDGEVTYQTIPGLAPA